MSNTMPDDDLMLAQLFALAEGALPAEEAHRLAARLAADSELAQAFAELQALRAAVAAPHADGFAAGFAERVEARLLKVTSTTRALQREFRRLLPLAAAVILALGITNVVRGRATGASTWEAALGLTPVSLDMALSTDSGFRTGEATP